MDDNRMLVPFDRDILKKFLENDADAILDMQETVEMFFSAEELGIDLLDLRNRN